MNRYNPYPTNSSHADTDRRIVNNPHAKKKPPVLTADEERMAETIDAVYRKEMGLAQGYSTMPTARLAVVALRDDEK